MAEMTKLRKEDISLYMYLKHVVLSDFIEKEELVPLQYMSEMSTEISCVYEALTNMVPNPVERGRGWVYLDNSYDSIEQSDRVIVYDNNGVEILDSEYMLDYIDGRIVTSGTCDPKYVSFDWYTVSLVDEWASVESAEPNVVVIDIHGTDKIGYQLGAGKLVTRKVDLHVFADSPAVRNDIVEKVHNGLYLRSCPVYDFPKGTILDYDGTFYGRRENMNKNETLFDWTTTVSGVIGNMYFDNIISRNVSLPLLMTRGMSQLMLSDLNAYRAKISFDMCHYTES